MLSASAGFGINPRTEQILDRTRRVRRIIRAHFDHIAMVEAPAHDGARVLAVRSATPNLDKWRNDPIYCWAQWYCDPVVQWAHRRSRHEW